jgi:predicted DNA-binding transcriptional regulator AlpA
MDILFSPIRLNELETLIEKSFERVLTKINTQTQPSSNQQSKFGDIDWFRLNHPRHLTKSTIYCRISNGKIPKSLIFKPEGTKNVLFYKDRVLEWINQGFPKDYQPRNEE